MHAPLQIAVVTVAICALAPASHAEDDFCRRSEPIVYRELPKGYVRLGTRQLSRLLVGKVLSDMSAMWPWLADVNHSHYFRRDGTFGSGGGRVEVSGAYSVSSRGVCMRSPGDKAERCFQVYRDRGDRLLWAPSGKTDWFSIVVVYALGDDAYLNCRRELSDPATASARY